MKKMVVATLIIISLIGLSTCGFYSCRKSFNYSIQYKGRVQETVRDMVKEECLQNK